MFVWTFVRAQIQVDRDVCEILSTQFNENDDWSLHRFEHCRVTKRPSLSFSSAEAMSKDTFSYFTLLTMPFKMQKVRSIFIDCSVKCCPPTPLDIKWKKGSNTIDSERPLTQPVFGLLGESRFIHLRGLLILVLIGLDATSAVRSMTSSTMIWSFSWHMTCWVARSAT